MNSTRPSTSNSGSPDGRRRRDNLALTTRNKRKKVSHDDDNRNKSRLRDVNMQKRDKIYFYYKMYQWKVTLDTHQNH